MKADSSRRTFAVGNGDKPCDRMLSWLVPGAFVLYLGLHVLLRLAISPGAELDEAEQLVLTQRFALVYGSQPPLYSWLQSLVFVFTGPTVSGLALLKNLLLFVTYSGTYFLAASVSGDRRRGALAALMMLLIPQVVWESQRDLTHSVLVTSVAVVTLLALRFLQKHPSPARFALLGLVLGAGVLSKYNYLFFAAALGAAAWVVPEMRRMFRSRAAWFVPLAAFLAVLPHFAAALGDAARVTADVEKFGIGERGGWLPGVATGLAHLAAAVLAYLGPLTAVALLVWMHRRRRTQAAGAVEEKPQVVLWRRLLCRTASFGVLLCAGLALFAGVTEFKDRWMQPLLFFVPIVIVLWIRGPVARKLLAWAGIGAVCVALTVYGLLWGRTSFSGKGRLAVPFEALGEQMHEVGLAPEVILGGDRFTAGNFRLLLPGSLVLAPETPKVDLPDGLGVAAVWLPGEGEQTERELMEFARTLNPPMEPAGEVLLIEAARKHSSSATDFLKVIPMKPEENDD